MRSVFIGYLCVVSHSIPQSNGGGDLILQVDLHDQPIPPLPPTPPRPPDTHTLSLGSYRHGRVKNFFFRNNLRTLSTVAEHSYTGNCHSVIAHMQIILFPDRGGIDLSLYKISFCSQMIEINDYHLDVL